MTKQQIATLLRAKGYVDTNEKLVRTSSGTFAAVKKKSFGPPSNPENDNRSNRAQTLWKMSENVIIEDNVSTANVWDGHAAKISEESQILESWKLVTSRDPDRPNRTQRLYFTNDGTSYSEYDAEGVFISSGKLDDLIPTIRASSSATHKETPLLDAYLSAIRTKPFILLAGISGTGKSRLVRQLARGCCPDGHELGKDKDGTANAAKKPGNFEMIPVRPNWHDSSELMGYVTRITDDGKPKYVIKPFVKFLVKAAIYKNVPFFLCLDEMNLAPVEQYFAEYLSVVETRKAVKDAATGAVTDIVSDVLVDFDQPEIDTVKTAQELMADWLDFSFAVGEDEQPTITVVEKIPGAKAVYDQIVADKGVRIPRNFVVMGTVNMDETTCSFSRKVLDRAMTFELNEVYMDEGLATNNEIPYGAIPPDSAFVTAVEGFDFYSANEDLCKKIKEYLETLNAVLDGTPFKFAYRSRNEIMLYCIERMKSGVVELPTALDEATSMKILSRIEGDEDKLAVYKMQGGNKVRESLLESLIKVIPAALKAANGNNDPNPACEVCAKKLEFMQNRLAGGFTNFFV